MSLIKNSRIISVDILTNVLLRGKNLKEEFESQVIGIEDRDKAFIKMLVYGVLRSKESIDFIVQKYYQKSYSKLKERYKNIFRIGLYQLDRMDSVPNYASVNTTVEIAKKENLKFSKIVNAILMNFIRNKDSIPKDKKILNHSKSLILEFQKTYDQNEILELCKWNNSIPTVWFRCNSQNFNKICKDKNIVIKKHSDFNNYICFDNTKYAIDNFVNTNLINVQSPSSELILKMLDINKNDVIIDACSAPGGKAKYIDEIIDSSNQFYLNDKNPKRYLLLKKNFKNKIDCITCKDASKDVFPIADKILLDVPCSSTGTIQKNPDIKWKKMDLDKLNLLQFKILKNMSKFVRKNGAIIYSTCSVNESENFSVIDRFLKHDKSFRLEDASKIINKKYVDMNGCLSIFPPKFKLEGMFAARLLKI